MANEYNNNARRGSTGLNPLAGLAALAVLAGVFYVGCNGDKIGSRVKEEASLVRQGASELVGAVKDAVIGENEIKDEKSSQSPDEYYGGR